MKVEAVPNLPMVTVQPGFAINRVLDEKTNEKISQEIWVFEEDTNRTLDLSPIGIGKNIYITVSYKKELVDIDTVKGGDTPIHIWEHAEINASAERPKDESKDIIIACVQLVIKDGIMIVDPSNIVYDYILDENGKKVNVCTYAVTQGNTGEFQKIKIGNKDKLNLPYINGITSEAENGIDGLEVNSAYTNFTGKVTTGDFNTNGDAKVNGNLSVRSNNKPVFNVDTKGNMQVSSTATVTGMLTAAGGLNVSGTNAVIGTENVEFSGNTILLNKYTSDKGETTTKDTVSGIEVYRGGVPTPNAKIVWDEADGTWKAGTDKEDNNDKSGLYNLAYGDAWDTMKDKRNADAYHHHAKLCFEHDGYGISVDENGNATIDKSVTISGDIFANGGIITPYELIDSDDVTTQKRAKLVWNSQQEKWQICILTRDKEEIDKWIEGEPYNIAYGEEWEVLTNKSTADKYHHHSEFYNSNDGQVVMGVSNDGDVQVSNNLEVAKDLIVVGNLDVKGTHIISQKISHEVTENAIVVNMPNQDGKYAAEAGLEVYRGKNLDNARLIWDEASDSWKLGIGNNLSEIPSGEKWNYITGGEIVDHLHKHTSLNTVDGNKVLSVDKSGYIKAEKDMSVNGCISVKKDASVSGELVVNGSAVFNGNITVMGTQTVVNAIKMEVDNNTILVNKRIDSGKGDYKFDGGLEVYRGKDNPTAKLIWDEAEEQWKVGISGDLYDLPYGDDWDKLTTLDFADTLHKHSMICKEDGDPIIELDGNEVLVEGSMKIKGDLNVTGKTITKNKENEITDEAFLIINNKDNDNFSLSEAGIEVYRGNLKDKARIVWDEYSKKWKIGIGSKLKDIICDNPTQLYNERGDVLGLSVRAAGNVDIAHDLNVGQDLTITGSLDVRGGLTRINSSNIEIVSNIITMNRFDSGTISKKSNTGISVYRGDDAKTAVMVWDEANGCWKMGLTSIDKLNPSTPITDPSNTDPSNADPSNTDPSTIDDATYFKVFNDGSIEATNATITKELKLENASVQGELFVKNGINAIDNSKNAFIKWNENRWEIGSSNVNVLTVKDERRVGIGDNANNANLDVYGSAYISSAMTVKGSLEVSEKTTLNEVSATTLKVGNNLSFTKSGLEVSRFDEDGNKLAPAKINWNEKDGCWQFGTTEENMISLTPTGEGEHAHNVLYTEDKKNPVVTVSDMGYVGVRTTKPTTHFEVSGNAKIKEKLEAKTVDISNDTTIGGKATIAGKVTIGSSNKEQPAYEIHRGATKQPAKLCWDEERKVWQAGYDNIIKDISLSDHKHTELGDVKGVTDKISVDGSNINMGTNITEVNLKVNGNTTITGNLIVKEPNKSTDLGIATIESLTVNKGLKVNNGPRNPKAQIIWENEKWKAGTEDGVTEISLAGHTHNALQSTIDAGRDALKVDIIDNKDAIVLGTTANKVNLEVNGDAKITGAATISGAATITGAATISGGATIGGRLSAHTLASNEGLRVARGGGKPNAIIKWNEDNECWQAGIDGGSIENISLADHKHNALKSINDATKEALKVANVENKETIVLGTTNDKVNLEVNGDAKITGGATIGGRLSAITLASNEGLRVARGGGKPNAIIKWNEDNECWQAGIDGGSIENISLADHKHNALKSINDATKEALKVANVENKETIVLGTTNDKVNLEVNGDAKITGGATIGGRLSAHTLASNEGLRVARGGGKPNAIIKWNEDNECWQAGIDGGDIQNISLADHKHNALQSSIESGKEVLKVTADDNIEIGTEAEDANLKVFGSITATKGLKIVQDDKTYILKVVEDDINNTYKLQIEALEA
ncbi:hypothetical protein EHE19_012880 [Ruminiclostridium herbifermentans]|uniref:Uncharacterized protein n=1 Tax=Ruminiclostridium herbifermentans TaxID=2488810 RepID=A0A7H1VK82_9FIRM|nr:hypothetical protein [Ruminiclostridium herbifermentans]QNU65794.1 hypothetical protein EHE19_012880 [Ruminiclostridium herbifermentans]